MIAFAFPESQNFQTRLQHVDVFLFSWLLTWKDTIFIVYFCFFKNRILPTPSTSKDASNASTDVTPINQTAMKQEPEKLDWLDWLFQASVIG